MRHSRGGSARRVMAGAGRPSTAFLDRRCKDVDGAPSRTMTQEAWCVARLIRLFRLRALADTYFADRSSRCTLDLDSPYLGRPRFLDGIAHRGLERMKRGRRAGVGPA